MTRTNTRRNNAPSLTLQVGKRYVQRDGTVTGGLVENGNSYYPFRCHVLERIWEADGTWMRGARNQRDIVAEYQEPKEESTMNSFKLEVGKTYRTLGGSMLYCVAELSGDKFALLCGYNKADGKFNSVRRHTASGISIDGHDSIISEWVDPPKTKKVLMYPALISGHYSQGYIVSSNVYLCEHDAKVAFGDSFIRLLTDRPIEVEVSV